MHPFFYKPKLQHQKENEQNHRYNRKSGCGSRPVQGKGFVIGLVYQVGAGVIRPALGNDLDGRKDILQPLHDGDDKHIHARRAAHGQNELLEK